tara:strand:- start:253 stop:546 length:294 start_codon:yes stop_codon:yes gene_type:complete
MSKSAVAIGLSSAALALGVVAVTLNIVDNVKPKHNHHKAQMHKMEKCKKAMMENKLHNAQARFEKMDTNKDGSISQEEWNTAIEQKLAKIKEKHKRA